MGEESREEAAAGEESVRSSPGSGEPAEVGAYELHLAGAMRPAWHARLAGLGVGVECAVGEHVYRVLVTPTTARSLRALEFVVTVRAEPRRAHAESTEESAEESAEAEPAARVFEASVYRAGDLAAVLALLQGDTAVRVLDRSADTVRFEAPADRPVLARLRALPTLARLQPYRPPSLFCAIGRGVVGAETARAALGLSGAGEVVAVLDSSVDDHRDLTPAIVGQASRALPGCLARDTLGHGTHVAGIVAGRGAVQGTAAGVAPAAQLAILSVTDAASVLRLPVDWATMFDQITQDGATICNLSWGFKVDGQYTAESQRLDQYVYAHPEVLMVVAAGNDGNAIADGRHAFRTVSAPATAKNVIAVGACATESERAGCPVLGRTWGQRKPQNFPKPPASDESLLGPPLPRIAAISSRGPTDEDSVKPEVVAPGVCIESTRAQVIAQQIFDPCPTADAALYVCCTGTSMAAPFVSGVAALLREWLRTQRQVQRPTAALLKALIVAAARRIGAIAPERGGYPDFDQGFGLVDLTTLLAVPGAPPARRVAFRDVRNDSPEALQSGAPTAGSTRSARFYTLEVPAGAHDPLRVVLVWTDFPGSALQNRLALEVRTPSGASLVGNHEHARPPDPFGAVPFDRKNCTQVVRFAAPEPGVYRVRVVARSTAFPVDKPRQGFALVAAGELAADELIEVTGS